MRPEPGMLIKTNYGGPYRIISVKRGCTCPSYFDELEMDEPPERRPHLHLICSKPDGKGRYYLDDWDEESLLSLEKSCCGGKEKLDYDRIFILEQDQPIQLTLF